MLKWFYFYFFNLASLANTVVAKYIIIATRHVYFFFHVSLSGDSRTSKAMQFAIISDS